LIHCLWLPLLGQAVIYLKIFWLKVYAFGENYVTKWKFGVEFAVIAAIDLQGLLGPLSLFSLNWS